MTALDQLADRLKNELARSCDREEALRIELEKLYVSALSEIQQKVTTISQVVEDQSRKSAVVSEINSDAKSLASRASRLCDRVRVLDTTLGNLRTAKNFISGLDALKDVDVQLRAAVEVRDVARGALLVTQVRNFEKSGFSRALDRQVVSRYKEWEEKLLVLLKKELELAVNQKDAAKVETFVRTLFAVGLEKEAMDTFYEFVRSVFSERCYARATAAVTADSMANTAYTAIHVEAVTQIFLEVADVIQRHESFIASEFGEQHFGDFLQQIEYEANAHAVRVIRALMKTAAVAQQQIQRDSSEFTVRTLDFCLEELVAVVMRCKRFGSYVTQLRGRPSESSIGSLQQVLEEVAGAYVAGEQALITCLFGKAIKEDLVDVSEPSPAAWTPVVDDAFFIFKKALDRSVLTTDSNCACAVINNISNMIQVDLKDFLESSFEQSKRLFGYFCGPSMGQSDMLENPLTALFKLKNDDSAASAQSEPSPITSGDSLPHALGNIAISSLYLTKFKQDCLDTYDRTFKESERRAMFLQCLSGLDLVASELNDLHISCTKYMLQCVRGIYINPFVNAFDSVNFNVSKEGFGEMQVNDPFMQAFLASLDTLVRWIDKVAVPETTRLFLGILCDYIALRLEKSLLQSRSRFSLLGATQLYQDVARLVAFFAEATEVGVKTKFGRLQQLCSILCLESLAEFAQMYPHGCEGGPLLAYRISLKDARTVLSLRSEFSHDAIATTIIC